MGSQVPLVCLQLIFHLQTCEPPVLPPLHELFQDSCSAIASRPIHMGKDINWDMLDVSLPDALLDLTSRILYAWGQNHHGDWSGDIQQRIVWCGLLCGRGIQGQHALTSPGWRAD